MKSIHDQIIDDVVKRLWSCGRYVKIEICKEYGKRSNVIGEIDILATTYQGFEHFYEIKSNDKYEAKRKAKEQFHRYVNTFKDYNIKGIYVSFIGEKITSSRIR